MHEKRKEYYQAERIIDISTCDLCKKKVTQNTSSCPSENSLLPLFIGYDTRSRGMYGDVFGQTYGIEGVEMCIDCRERWFKEILEMFPNARLVKIND